MTATAASHGGVGEAVTYSLEVSGSADVRMDNVTMTFDLPEQTDFVGVDGWGCKPSANRRRVTCAYGTQTGGTFGRPDITVKIKDTVAVGTTISALFTTSRTVDNVVVAGGEATARTTVLAGGQTCQVVKNESLFPQPRSLTLSALPSGSAEQERLQIKWRLPDIQPTGHCLRPGRPLTVNVSGGAPSGTIELQVGTWALADPYSRSEYRNYPASGSNPRSYPLKPGANTVTDATGGIIYLRYTSANPASAPPLVVDLGSGDAVQPIPHHEYKKTTNAQWREMLAAVDGGFVEAVGPHIMSAGLREHVLAYQGEDQDQLIDTYETVLQAEDEFSGLDGSSSRDTRTPLRYLISQTYTGSNPNAGNNRVAYPGDRSGAQFSAVETGNDWGVYHEFGHQHQQRWSWGDYGVNEQNEVTEVTVNLYSTAADARFTDQTHGWGDQETWAPGRAYLAQDVRDWNQAPNRAQLSMFVQLQRAFGDNFYPRLHQQMRAEKPPLGDKDAQMRWFATTASRLAGADLTDHLTTSWGLPLNQQTRDALAALHLPKADPAIKDIPAFTGVRDQRSEIVRFTNSTHVPLRLAAAELAQGTNLAVRPDTIIAPGRTTTLRVTTGTDSGIQGTITYRGPDNDRNVAFTFNSPRWAPNNYAVTTGPGVQAVTTDENQAARTTAPGTTGDAFDSHVLGGGNNPTIWVDIRQP
ncbi:M60 family metallopeptidase [Kitasatospora purpeofusca]|uniref:M60 family metallopeptidase n=1 Tax=Kitasatospora purpeofusca TaxID=67352 RepID=UPI0033C3EB8C